MGLDRRRIILVLGVLLSPAYFTSIPIKGVDPDGAGREKKILRSQITNNMTFDDNMLSWKFDVHISANTSTLVAGTNNSRQGKDYSCTERPSNFSWFYGYPRAPLNTSKWASTKLYFAGGSTTRQMKEQLSWEMAPTKTPLKIGYDFENRFLFLHHQKACCSYDGHMILDMRALSPSLEEALNAGYDFIIVNVGTWWPSRSIGKVIDREGIVWPIMKTNGIEWEINKTQTSSNHSLAGKNFPNVTFANMMSRALNMIMTKKKPSTTLVWRSETKTDCPVGSSFRAIISSVLKELNIQTLNISEATCQYAGLNLDDSATLGPHLCFPSVVLRYWLQEFESNFLL